MMNESQALWAWELYHMAGVRTGTKLSKEQFLVYWWKLSPEERNARYLEFLKGEPTDLNRELVFAV